MRRIAIGLFVFCLMMINSATAVPASPYPFTLEQPDGYSFQAKQYGDERLHWIETLDGYSIVENSAGYWTYAQRDNSGKLITSQIKVGDSDVPSTEKHLRPMWNPDKIARTKSSPSPINIKIFDHKVNGVSRAPGTVTTEKAIVILINFTDVSQQPAHTKSYYDNLIFNNTTGSNSMFNYYREVSYNQLNVTGTTGSKWFQSSHSMAYYGEDATDTDENTTRSDPNTWYIFNLAREAVKLADSYIDFSQYDTDSDGVVDHVIIVHAGSGQESSGSSSNDIWSHKWSIWNYHDEDWHEDGEMTLDGVKVIGYTMLAEGSPLGTFAHEFFHDLGAPDLYDYDTEFDEGYPVQDWDLMAGGSWANSGDTPTHMGGYLKWDIDADPNNGINGWLTPTTVSTPQTIAIDQLESTTGNRLFKVDIPETNQYFLVENRQKTGYDAFLPEAGILIWHIDEDMISYYNATKDGWVNLNDGLPWNPYYRVWVEDPGNTIPKDGAAYSSDDGQTSFNQTTTPNSSQNNGAPTGIRIYNIGAEGSSMNVTFFNTAPTVNVTFPNGGETISGNMTITWTHSDIDPTDTHTFTIKLSSDGGATYPTTIVPGLGESVSSYVYNTTSLSDGSNYKIQVIATDNYTLPLSGNDSSDGVFIIDNYPAVLIGNPTGYPEGQTAAKNGSQITLNVTIIDEGAGVKNATVDASQINASLITPLILEKVNNYWINQSVIVNAADGIFNLPVTVYDNASNVNTSSVIQVTVDNTPPIVIANPTGYPDGFTAVNNGSKITFNASISDTGAGIKNATVNVSQINSSLGDIQLIDISGFWINDSVIVMAPDGTYFLNITSYDNASNYNDSAQVEVVVDNTIPIIYSANANPSAIESNGTDNTLLNVTAIDAGSGIASVSINLSAIGGLSAQPMSNNSGVWQFTTNTTTVGTFELPVNVTDNAGNSNTSANISLNATDTTSPVVIDTSPKNMATDVKIDSSITATFSEPMNSSTLNNTTVKVYKLASGKITGETFENVNGTWNSSNFQSFSHTEELKIEQAPIDDTHRTIVNGSLIYSTQPVPRYYQLYIGEGIEVKESENYSVISWLGDEYIAVNGKPDKLTNLVFEQKTADTKTLQIGETWDLGDGYSLKILQIDAGNPKAWMMLNDSSGLIAEDFIIDNQSADYLKTTIANESDVPFFVTYLNKVTSTAIELKYTWLISQDATVIETDDLFGVFKVISISSDAIRLTNEENVSLTRGSTIPLVNDLKFEVEDNSTVRYRLVGTGEVKTALEGDISYDSASRTVTFDPVSNLMYSTSYISYITTGVEDPVGNGLIEDYKWEFNTISYTPPYTPSSSSGGGGGGSSGEKYENIEFKDVSRVYISSNADISFTFDKAGNDIQYVNYRALTSAGYISTVVEMLKDISTFAKEAAPDISYKNINIWVGKSGYATETNIENPVIGFKVEKKWIQDNDIEVSSIKLNRYHRDTWTALSTAKTDEDSTHLYFESQTPGFSPFAITGQKKTLIAPTPTVPPEESIEEPAPAIIPDVEVPPEPTPIGKYILIGAFILLIIAGAYLYLRKQQS